MRYLLLLVMMLTPPIIAGCSDCCQAADQIAKAIDAACLIRGSDGTKSWAGTGTVFQITQSTVRVLTAGHVCPTQGMTVQATFYHRGYDSTPLSGKVVWVSYGGGPPRDCAVVEFDANLFGGIFPQVIPIASESVKLPDGATVISTGCPGGTWPNAFKGHVLRQDAAVVALTPQPQPGRSGSGLLDETGTYIVGIICWAAESKKEGYAVSLTELYRAFRGESPGRPSVITCAVREAGTGRTVTDPGGRRILPIGTASADLPNSMPWPGLSQPTEQARPIEQIHIDPTGTGTSAPIGNPWPELQCPPGGPCPTPQQPQRQWPWQDAPREPAFDPLDAAGKPLIPWPPTHWTQWLAYAVVAYLAYRLLTRKATP
jgi:hypothetical protein